MWLYPIAKDTSFSVRGRTSPMTGAAGFADIIARGAIDGEWGVSTNFKNVAAGDELVVYATKTSASPPLLIGLGTVLEGPYDDERSDTPLITIKWNVAICRRLAGEPIDAGWLSAQLPTTKPTVTAIPARLWPKLRELLAGGAETSTVSADIEEVLRAPKISKTVRQQLVEARLGQGLFKINVGRIERGCRLTGVTDRFHLRASHIKPWRDSTNEERLDGHNGLLLAPHVDHLFDRGLITFSGRGRVLVSPRLEPDVLAAWGLRTRNVGGFSDRQAQYLDYHRTKVFKSV